MDSVKDTDIQSTTGAEEMAQFPLLFPELYSV